ncbi:hypothetical protein ITI46_21920 [Streptomyces oryzae]|uniref:Uncharacterized protein n=1 Tax=Streptomyces oryzae TaxID=1434886 RepID=A0ABS3XFY1_9ACTN|nr:Imm21 family immunity protein [Streptomyces oryzae]MBO8194297.1 hypothetical protein [Streptomyces oryzae]
MSIWSFVAADVSDAAPVWVDATGGPLVVVPVSALAVWSGCTESGVMAGDATAPDDYDRACAVDGLAGAAAVGNGGAQALVLADEPASSCYLPEHRAFLRRLAADSADGLTAAAQTVLADPATEWEECGSWVSDGPGVLMDSAESGAGLDAGYPARDGMPAHALVPLPAGRWRVRATHTRADEVNWVGLVRILPLDT